MLYLLLLCYGDTMSKIGQNTEKSPGDLKRLVTQTPMKNHQLKLVRKTPHRVKLLLLCSGDTNYYYY